MYNQHNARGVVEVDRSGQSVYHACADASKFKFTSRRVLDAILRRLSTASASEIKELETDLGWKYVPGGVMFVPHAREMLDPLSKVNFDWAHIF